MSLDTTPQLTPVNLVRLDRFPALIGHYMEATEFFLSSGRQNIPLSGYRELKPRDILGTASSPLLRVPLESLANHDSRNDVFTVAAKPDTAPTTPNADNPDPHDEPSFLISPVGATIVYAKRSFTCGISIPHTSDA